jgi:hypothetical protein
MGRSREAVVRELRSREELPDFDEVLDELREEGFDESEISLIFTALEEGGSRPPPWNRSDTEGSRPR